VIDDLRRLARSKDLLYMLTWRDIQVRYKQSIMGFMWAILMPGLIVGAGVLVRVVAGQFSNKPVNAHDISAVMVRAVVWAFFVSGLRFGTNSLVGNPNLVSKIAFAKEVFPISAVLASLFDFLVASVAVVVTLLLIGWRPSAAALLAIPLLLLLVMFTFGLTLIMSSANLFFRDVKYLVEVILTYAIFFTPVLYEASMLGKWKNVVLLNPVAPILEGISGLMVSGRVADPLWIIYSIAVSFMFLVFGYWLFKKLEAKFAERI
jgi:lipopolysaccharide transport system permease protein